MRMRDIGCGLAAGAAAFAASAALAGDVSFTTTIGFESRYIFRGVQFAETSFQPAINVAIDNFYGGVWLNLPIGDDDLVVTPGGEELDLFVGYSAPLTDKITYDIGLTYYTFPDLASGFFDLYEEDGDGLGANTFEPYLGFAFDVPLSPAIYVFHDFMFDTTTFQGKATYSHPLAEKMTFDVGGVLGYVIDDDPGGDYLYGVVSADVVYNFTDAASLKAGVRYGGSDIPGGSFIDDSIAGTSQSSGFWWGLALASSF